MRFVVAHGSAEIVSSLCRRIWYFRYSFYHSNVPPDFGMVASRGRSSIAEFVAVRLLSCHIPAARPSAVRWMFPPPGFLEVSVDMALNAAGDTVGFGARSWCLALAGSRFADAVLLGLCWLRDMQFRRLGVPIRYLSDRV
ncbi:hypothetical protein V6N13_146742 [Hibiscus sabdariffa]|uniref:Uncharacterized protein n=1 Tax=Hibiscus sabdariffa TaxID=183260 RepID=A0ABR2TTV2_9ROSI